MSYEGYTQALCAKGHSNNIGQYEEQEICHWCPEKLVWFHGVDQTNGCYCDSIPDTDQPCAAHPVKLELATEPDYHVCPTCNHAKMASPPTYKIPESE